MLVLSRKVRQKLVIGNDIEITVTKIKGGRVSLGIDAPQKYVVRREDHTPPAISLAPETRDDDA